MQANFKPQIRVANSGPAPIAAELLKLIGGGVTAPASAPTPQAPKNKW